MSQVLNSKSRAEAVPAAGTSFRVVCSLCHRTVSFAGQDGEIFHVVCDQCAGVQ